MFLLLHDCRKILKSHHLRYVSSLKYMDQQGHKDICVVLKVCERFKEIMN